MKRIRRIDYHHNGRMIFGHDVSTFHAIPTALIHFGILYGVAHCTMEDERVIVECVGPPTDPAAEPVNYRPNVCQFGQCRVRLPAGVLLCDQHE